MKKIIALLLTLLLLANICPAAAGAEDDLRTDRRLSDEEIAALDLCRPADVRAAISTVGDAWAYLNRRYPSLWHDAGTSFYQGIRTSSITLQATFYMTHSIQPAVAILRRLQHGC